MEKTDLPMGPWRNLDCGHLISTRAQAAEHRRLTYSGPSACYSRYSARRLKARAARSEASEPQYRTKAKRGGFMLALASMLGAFGLRRIAEHVRTPKIVSVVKGGR